MHVDSDRTRENGFKLKEEMVRLDVGKKLVTWRVAKYWNRLPRQAMDTSSLEASKSTKYRNLQIQIVFFDIYIYFLSRIPFYPFYFAFTSGGFAMAYLHDFLASLQQFVLLHSCHFWNQYSHQ